MKVNRRKFISGSLAFGAASIGINSEVFGLHHRKEKAKITRPRPGLSGWPSEAEWNTLNDDVNGNLVKIYDPMKQLGSSDEKNQSLLTDLRNPFVVSDNPALTQNTGWLKAWSLASSEYAVVVKNARQVASAVKFADKHNLRLVVKGGGHSYQGTSSSIDSLLIWTRNMNRVTIHNSFVVLGDKTNKPGEAVSIEAGALWMDAYREVTTKAGRYVQGGGCTTVGVGGHIQSGGFGSFSKKYGLACAHLLQAEIITAKGEIITANEYNHPDLFWAIKGGGGGTFGVVTKLTLRTHKLPAWFGMAFGTIKANSDQAYQALIEKFFAFYLEILFNDHWGEQVRFRPDKKMAVMMMFQGLTKAEADAVWKPFINWVASKGTDYIIEIPLRIAALPAQSMWDASFFKTHFPSAIVTDKRSDSTNNNFYWAGDGADAGQYIYGYKSLWLKQDLLNSTHLSGLAEAMFNASRRWPVSIHFNKGLAGTSNEVKELCKNTAMNPVVLDSFALAIIGGGGGPAFLNFKGYEPDTKSAEEDAKEISAAYKELSKLSLAKGSYVSESDYFEEDWQNSFWGENYSRLSRVKEQYDPRGLFFVRHGVGSERWSDDGFNEL